MCVCVCVCVRTCVRACVHVSFCVPPGALFSESGHDYTQKDFVAVKFPNNYYWPIIVPGLERSNKDTFLKDMSVKWTTFDCVVSAF